MSHPPAFTDIPKIVHTIQDIRGPKAVKRISRTRSNHVIVVQDCSDSTFIVQQNQRLSMLLFIRCTNCKFLVLDSAVVVSRTCRIINCSCCEFVFEDVDVRKVEVFGTNNCDLGVIFEAPLIENVRVLWRENCAQNRCHVAAMEAVQPDPYDLQYRFVRTARAPDVLPPHGPQCTAYDRDGGMAHMALADAEGQQLLGSLKRFTPAVLSCDTHEPPSAHDVLASLAALRATPCLLTQGELEAAYDAERREYEDPPELLARKATAVAQTLRRARWVTVYTGAGISTSADIPDFRGPQGVWTLRDKGLAPKAKGFEHARPTYAHYALTELVRRGLVHAVVSTNMDGLHLRSGLPADRLVEMHGNIYRERCERCGREYMRQERVSGNGRLHYTGGVCPCGGRLQDTIVHFSEDYRSPDIPRRAMDAACRADVALVIGASLNVQSASAYPDKALCNDGGEFVICNLQPTPLDHVATQHLFARSDAFARALMESLGIPEFDTETDTIKQWR